MEPQAPGPPPDHRAFADFDDEVRANDLLSLHDLLTAPISEQSLTKWAGDSLSRHSLLSETTWCSIRWPKALGQPRGPTFASGFTVTHQFWWLEAVDIGGGVIVKKWRPANAPSGPLLFPGAADATHYWVAMLVYPVFYWKNELRVELSGVPWEQASLEFGPHGFRQVVPAVQQFQYLRGWGPPVVLDDFEVVSKAFRVIG